MHGNCLTCAFAKKYADDRASKNGVMIYCGWYKKASHINATCEEYQRDNVKANEHTRSLVNAPTAPCSVCGFTWYAHQLNGMRGATCEEYQLPALAQQDELFALDTVVKRRGASMDA